MTDKKKKICGIIMPISECDGRPASHWADVLKIVEEAASSAGFEARLVSDTFESNLIHKEILQNIYHDDMIVCDVSGRNPNVFFELGVRMATQKPTVIIKDDKTSYPFDTSPNRYIEYPRDLRYPLVEKFKIDLVSSVKKSIEHNAEKSFIGQLGPFKVPDIESTKLPAGDIILDRLEGIERRMADLFRSTARERGDGRLTNLPYRSEFISSVAFDANQIQIEVQGIGRDQIQNGLNDLKKIAGNRIQSMSVNSVGKSVHMVLILGTGLSPAFAELAAQSIESAIPF